MSILLTSHFFSGKQSKMTYQQWDQKIQASFEKHFWIASDADKSANKLINRRGIYKDTVGATQFWGDYQLRPNFPIAMVVVSLISYMYVTTNFFSP